MIQYSHFITVIIFYNNQKKLIYNQINDISYGINNLELAKENKKVKRKIKKRKKKKGKKKKNNVNLNLIGIKNNNNIKGEDLPYPKAPTKLGDFYNKYIRKDNTVNSNLIQRFEKNNSLFCLFKMEIKLFFSDILSLRLSVLIL